MQVRVAAALAALFVLAGVASAEGKNLRQTYTDVRYALVKAHGARAAGRNIRRFGVNTGTGTRSATGVDYTRSIAIMRRALHPGPYLAVAGFAPPKQAPTMAMTASYAPSGVASCVVAHESGGDPQAVNGQYSGVAQWSPEAWGRMGGTRYASSPTGATYQQQLQVLSYGLAHFGCRDWCPYDGC